MVDGDGADADAIAGQRLRVYRFFLKSVGRVADAEDLTQRTLMTALELRMRFRGESSLSTWLFGIAVNHLRAHLRGRRRDDAMGGEEVLAALPWSGEDPEAALSRRRELLRLSAAMARLPQDQREIVVVVSLEGLSYEEAALALGVPIGTVRSRLSRAKQVLRRALTGADIVTLDQHEPEFRVSAGDPAAASEAPPVPISLAFCRPLRRLNANPGSIATPA